MILVLLLMPILAGMVAFFIKSDKIRRGLLLTTAFLHLGLTTTFWSHRPGPLFDNWLSLDAPGLLFLSITSFLFGVAAVYGVGYLIREESTPGAHSDEGSFFPNTAESVFTGCLLIFLATMTLVPMSQHLGLLWVAIESTTLASAPLIYFHRHHQ